MDPLVFVIFGASGDLTKRKLIPAIYNAYKRKLVPDSFAVLGVSRTSFTDEAFRDRVFNENEHIKDKGTDEQQNEFVKKLFYQPIDTKSTEDYEKVKNKLAEIDGACNTSGNYAFYMSTPPSLYEVIAKNLSAYGLCSQESGLRRLVVEKPFGYDLASAKELNQKLLKHFEESQIYRIDHYLGKETVQNLLVTRFANGIFEPLWNRNYIHHIEITASEHIGVGDRGGYYEGSGAMRDMIQNHLLQMVAHVAMEPPIEINADAIRGEKVKLLQSIRPIKEEEVEKYVIRGQYVASKVRGEQQKGYREEEGVDPNSKTETFVAMKFFIDNWRWAGVPFYIRTGKSLPTKVTEIVVRFKRPPHHLFQNNGNMINSDNMLVIRIQPNEGILLKFGMKVPGAGFEVKTVNMDFHYADLSNAYIPDAYERLLVDLMQGDATLYTRGDSVEAAWAFVDPILSAWKNNPDIKVYGYPAGTWGPEHADQLIEGENITWRYPCKNLAEDGEYCEL